MLHSLVYFLLAIVSATYLGTEAALHGSGGQVFNPPHVNAISVPATDERPYCRMVAVARGDGAVVVYDADVRSGAQAPAAKQQVLRYSEPLSADALEPSS